MPEDWRRNLAAAVAVAALSAGSAGCASAGHAAASATAQSASRLTGHYTGDVLTNPIALPAVTLTDQNGRAFDLRTATSGKLVLLFIGYTHCPDECPTTMADIAVAMRRLTAQQQQAIDVVFITSDPSRDTPQQLKSWLSYFNPGFIGLTGAYPLIARTAKAIGVPIEPPVKHANGTVTVVHGTEVLAFTADRRSTLLYQLGFKAAPLAADLAQLERVT